MRANRKELSMVIAASTFVEVLFILFIAIPVTIAWVAAVMDLLIRRRDLSWWQVALWLLVILVLPLLGMLIYFLARPRLPEEEAAAAAAVTELEASRAAAYAQALTQLSDLKDRGVISDAEYEERVAKIRGAA